MSKKITESLVCDGCGGEHLSRDGSSGFAAADVTIHISGAFSLRLGAAGFADTEAHQDLDFCDLNCLADILSEGTNGST